MFVKYPNRIEWNKNNDQKETLEIIARSATLLASLRGSINVWTEHSVDGVEYSYQEPIIEMPDRINQIFYNIARGHAVACDRLELNMDDIKLILNIAFDSAPLSRTKIFRLLIGNDGFLTTQKVIEGLNCSDTTANKEMEILKILGIGNITSETRSEVGRPQKTLSLKTGFSWFKSDECLSLIGIEKKVDNENKIESDINEIPF
jgi:hypothetical protein